MEHGAANGVTIPNEGDTRFNAFTEQGRGPTMVVPNLWGQSSLVKRIRNGENWQPSSIQQ